MTVQLRIEPPTGWRLPSISELWAYRELFAFLIWRDVKIRYKQTVLGAAWAILQPAMMMVVFTILFGRFAKISTGSTPGPLFYLSGLLPWTFFATTLSSASNSVLGSERLITKVYFPRLIVPFSTVGAATVDFLVACVLLIGFLLVYSIPITAQLLLAPLVIALIAMLAVGLGTFLAALNVKFRDFRYLVPFLLQLGMFATPTIFLQPTGEETGTLAMVLQLNPMASLVQAFRVSILGGPMPWAGLGAACVLAMISMIGGCLYFRRVEDSFADDI
jgi:lipopolysaccharide transport system permease protein